MTLLATRIHPPGPGRWLRIVNPFVFACLLFAPVCAAAVGMRVALTPAGELFPALDLSQSGDRAGSSGNGLLRVNLSGVPASRTLRLTIDTDGLNAPTVIEVRGGGVHTLRPRLEWDVAALRRMKSARAQPLRFRLEGDGMAPIQQVVDVRVHPLDEALYYVREGGTGVDLGWAFAAWVNPHDPVVDELLELARASERVDLLPASDRDARLRQVRAVWGALERRGLRYAEEGAGISQGPVIYSQRVRLLGDTWDQRIANCLDGSVLIASALERLGIGAFIVLVPGHAFVGYHTDSSRRHTEFLETTLLGKSRPQTTSGIIANERLFREHVRAGFDAARAAGRQSYREAASRLDGRHRPEYAVIDISTARSYGIMPLAVSGERSTATAPTISASPVTLLPEYSLDP